MSSPAECIRQAINHKSCGTCDNETWNHYPTSKTCLVRYHCKDFSAWWPKELEPETIPTCDTCKEHEVPDSDCPALGYFSEPTSRQIVNCWQPKEPEPELQDSIEFLVRDLTDSNSYYLNDAIPYKTRLDDALKRAKRLTGEQG